MQRTSTGTGTEAGFTGGPELLGAALEKVLPNVPSRQRRGWAKAHSLSR